ncbi:MAG: hypothetical protein ISS72_10130 [Candidatus Brocadiae bacterium]|nr:hypothetical protein [Candidatus Brocadiia bacterium]
MKAAAVFLAALAATSLAVAAEQPVRHDRGRMQPMHQAWGQGSYRYRLNPFDIARRLVDLTDEQKGAVSKLQQQRQDDYRKQMAEAGRQLDKKFALLVVEIVGAENKGVYEKVLAAIAERDAAIEAARVEALAALQKLREPRDDDAQPYRYGSFIPRRKQDIIRTLIQLSDEQKTKIDGIRRDSYTLLREAMRDIPRPDDWRNEEARRQYSEAIRKAREDIETTTAQAMADALTDTQKKTYEAAQTIVDAHDKKVKDAEVACDKKLTELLGKEKFEALTRPQRPTRPDRGPRPAPEKKATEF